MARYNNISSDNNVFSGRQNYIPDDGNSSGDEGTNASSKESEDQFMELSMGTLGRRFARRHPNSLRAQFLRSIRRNDVTGVKETLQVRTF